MQQAMMNMKWHRPKWGIKQHKEMKVKTSWVDLFDDKVSLERLNQGGLLYPIICIFMEWATNYES